MRHAEQVTFGGSGFDRAAHYREDAAKIATMRASGSARALPVWRGKPLVTGEAGTTLAWLSPDHPVFTEAKEEPVFLGVDGATAYFAFDISAWDAPDADQAQQGNFSDQSEQRHPALPKTQRFVELRGIMTRLGARDAELAVMANGVFSWHRTHKFCARCGERSQITMAGWQRSCPMCNGQHFPRTDPVVIMLVTHGNKVLIGRSPQWPEGMFSLLAGFMEPGETIEAAVRREVLEETSIRTGQVDYLASQPWPFPSSLMFGCRAEALSTEITIDPKEIEAAKWVTREDILDAWAGNRADLIAARKGAIAHFLIRNWLSDTLC